MFLAVYVKFGIFGNTFFIEITLAKFYVFFSSVRKNFKSKF